MNAQVKMSRQLQELARMLEKKLDRIAGEHVGFALLVFRFNDEGRIDYVSNAARKDMNKALAEFVLNSLDAEVKGQPSPPPSHEVE
jgi:hypothetical protein